MVETTRRKYVESFKLKIMEETKESNNYAAASVFGITEKKSRRFVTHLKVNLGMFFVDLGLFPIHLVLQHWIFLEF